jgi:hypothetical protein
MSVYQITERPKCHENDIYTLVLQQVHVVSRHGVDVESVEDVAYFRESKLAHFACAKLNSQEWRKQDK